jgi:hypothetical protein
MDNGQKLIGVQTGSADEGAVYTVPAKQRRGVVWLHAATVLYGNGLSRFLSKHLSEAVPNDGVRVLRLLGSGMMFEIADGPDRFVRDAQAGQGIRRHVG